MSNDWNDSGDDWDEGFDDESDDAPLACPECGADVHADTEACPACGYWITEADRSAAWRGSSASGRIITIGLAMFGAAVLLAVLNWLLG